jgi:hypothetical protein
MAASGPKIDPELIRQLEETAANEQHTVEAVIRLKPDDASQIVPTPERTEALTKELLERVKKQVGKPALRYNVFKNLGSFVVSAPSSFIRELISQPEVAAAVANQQPGTAAIPPVKKATLESKKQAKSASKRKSGSSGSSKKGRAKSRY